MTAAPPGETMRPNTLGRCPPEAIGRRVRVRLGNGKVYGGQPVSPTAPLGWAADSCRWEITGHPFDIIAWELIG